MHISVVKSNWTCNRDAMNFTWLERYQQQTVMCQLLSIMLLKLWRQSSFAFHGNHYSMETDGTVFIVWFWKFAYFENKQLQLSHIRYSFVETCRSQGWTWILHGNRIGIHQTYNVINYISFWYNNLYDWSSYSIQIFKFPCNFIALQIALYFNVSYP